MDLLGPNWSYFVTDVTEGSPGNYERMAFLYNKNRVFFQNLIGELVLPGDRLIEGKQIARTPYFASFQASWFRFTLCSAHITFGGSSSEDKKLRAKEIAVISKALAKRAEKSDEVHIFLGDMNIEDPEDNIMAALTGNGFTAPLFGATNLSGTKHFDQIAYTGEELRTNLLNHSSFDWRDAVFGPSEMDHYKSIAEEARGEPYANWASSYRNWTSHQMSDHLPIWVELKTDYSDIYLADYLTE
ncbi:MAG: endonuclease/exonuclease/phosphatase family protein [Rhizobiaceae bacterium]|nr:endonuclease/exonuclease/phosphatase family protein [Rhizobiaceae bacterium]